METGSRCAGFVVTEGGRWEEMVMWLSNFSWKSCITLKSLKTQK